jgi:hypothetical protein
MPAAEKVPSFVLSSLPGAVKHEARSEGYPKSCGLVWEEARPRVKRLLWQTQGGKGEIPAGVGLVRSLAFLSSLLEVRNMRRQRP